MKTNNNVHRRLTLAKIIPKYTIGDEMKSPRAQISGSQFGMIGRYFCARNDPNGTPKTPASIAVIPNWYATLSCFKRTGRRVMFHIKAKKQEKQKRYLLIKGDILIPEL